MPDDGQAPEGGGGSLFKGKPIAGVPRPLAVGGLIVLGSALIIWWWRKKSAADAAASGTSTTGAGTGTGTDDSTLDDELLGALQQQPGGGGGTSGGGGDTSGGGTSGGGTGTGDGTGTGGTVFTPGGPGTTADESGSMHGISLAQARYLFDSGNQPYVFNPATGEFTRWSGTPVAGQTYYAGPLNWSQTLKGGNITGGTKGHPTYKSGTAPKAAPAKKPPAKVKPKAPVRK